MTKYKIRDPKAIACVVLACLCLSAIVILFTMGGIYFSEEHPKVLHYVKNMCRVDSQSYKTYQCKARYSEHTCYGPIWEVHHGENRSIYGVIESNTRYDSYLDALKKSYEYQVNKHSK
jgi:hypothetical protein